ncbi:High mobility group protein B1 [Microtus ochrogaster]|uniref:High mobility group protein B1 n=1 Tax=Microtus ochrogaster TaxID=79684 RepID=A0A8J6G9F5_MICOH|nr:High mobility group protein B1 [Microtus ochrogaster]
METYFHPQEEPKKMLKNPSALLRPPLASFISIDRGPTHLLVKWQRSCEMWADPAADDGQPQEGKATEQKGKYKEEAAAFRAKGKPGTSEKKAVIGEGLKGGGGGRQK